MFFFYYLLALLLVPFLSLYFLVFLWRRKDFRPHFLERLGRIPRVTTKQAPDLGHRAQPRCVWFHAVSVGEIMGALPLAKAMGARFPDTRFVLSTYTPMGRDTATKRWDPSGAIFYFPLDLYPVTERVIERVRPDLFLLIETDFWPGFLRGLSANGIPSVLVNGRISSRRLLLRPFYRRVIEQFSRLCVQTEVDRERLLELGVDGGKVAVTGNMKFAQASAREGDPSRLREQLGIAPGAVLLIAGSTHEGEEKEILRCYQKLLLDGREVLLLVAPRHPERVDKVEALFNAHGLPCVRRSRANGSSGSAVILLDTIGELSSAYALGTFIFVGGSLVKRGGHNVMEPAAWGKPIFFGPHMEHYSDIASSLEREGAAVRIKDGEDLAIKINRLADDERSMSEMGRKAAAFVAGHQGALERNLEIIEELLESHKGRRR
jgi:3-deoxy-D-manno-octulosonic-acid transferase